MSMSRFIVDSVSKGGSKVILSDPWVHQAAKLKSAGQQAAILWSSTEEKYLLSC